MIVVALLSVAHRQLNVVVSGDYIQPEFYGIGSRHATTFSAARAMPCRVIRLLLCGDWADIRLMLW
jgi:hypothetical protein